jgi:cation diffusion facilitator CzcD-associated flavoprotein CzcO
VIGGGISGIAAARALSNASVKVNFHRAVQKQGTLLDAFTYIQLNDYRSRSWSRGTDLAAVCTLTILLAVQLTWEHLG